MKKKTKTQKNDQILKLEALISKLNDENRKLYSRAVYAEDRLKEEQKKPKQPEPESVDLSAFDNVVLFKRAS